jgi:general secretion pathway protein A
MYEAYYGLEDLPFQLSPDLRFFYPSRGHRQAMAYLTYGLKLQDGFIVITGDVGAGKTTIVRHLLSQIDEDKFVSANIVTSQLDADDTLRMVAGTFGLESENRDKASVLRDIEAYLAAQREQQKHVFLVVDEVQNMPLGAIEELRMLSNFQRDSRPLIQCILIGQPAFRDVLARPEMDQIRQRIIATCHLGPLSEPETRAYIEHRLKTVGWNGGEIFTGGAFPLIHQMTDGVPRQINVLCGRLMLYAAMEETRRIDENIVDAVAREIDVESGAESSTPGQEATNGQAAELQPTGTAGMAVTNGTNGATTTDGYSAAKLLDEHSAAEMLSLKVNTLRRWRWAGTGPAFVKIGAAVRYEPAAMHAFIEQSRRQPLAPKSRKPGNDNG